MSAPHTLDPWVDAETGLVRVVVEIPAGSQNKYSYDPASGLFALDRPIHSALRYPADYGFLPGTMSEDGEAIDAVLLIPEPTFPGCLVRAHVVGAVDMEDEDGKDPKILCVPVKDPRTAHIREIGDVGPGVRSELEHFFTRIKDLEEGKWAQVDGFLGRERALELIAEAARRGEEGGE